MKASFFRKGTSLVIEMMTQKNLKGLERKKVSITSHVKVFPDNECNSYIHTARNAMVTSARNVHEKSVMKQKITVFGGVFRTHSNIYDEAF